MVSDKRKNEDDVEEGEGDDQNVEDFFGGGGEFQDDEEDDEGDDDDVEDDDDGDEDDEELEEDVSDGEIDEHDSLDDTDDDENKEESKPKGGSWGELAQHQKLEYDVDDDDDSSEDETMVNRVGNVPMHWYKDEDHIGYDVEGNKLMRPATKDQIEDFIAKADDPDYWRTVFDELNQKDVVLTDDELQQIARIRSGQFADADKFDPFATFPTLMEKWGGDDQKTALTGKPIPKSSFVASKWEAKKLVRMVKAIKSGNFKRHEVKKPDYNYLIWDTDVTNERQRRGGADLMAKQYIPAPKPVLPGHNESYNPPGEYLPTDEERAEWEAMDPDEREQRWLPTKFKSLREVPLYQDFIRERFDRCLDLYLCPRIQRMRYKMSSDELMPSLPNPRDLEPFPKVLGQLYKGHTKRVRCLSMSPNGEYFATGSDDCTIRVWEVDNGRCLKAITLPGIVSAVGWCPNLATGLVFAVVGSEMFFVGTGTGGDEEHPLPGNDVVCETKELAEWSKPTAELGAAGVRLVLKHNAAIKSATWHAKGDYFAACTPDAPQEKVIVHQLSKRRSQAVIKKSKGSKVVSVLFHPSRPLFFVATQQHVKVYDLVKQDLKQRLLPGLRYISSMDIHPGGDNLIIGSFDKKVAWMDRDLSTKPYKSLRNHKLAVRGVAFHRRYPLFASCSDDCETHVFHGMVYNDLATNPLVVPVKILRGHKDTGGFGVMSCQFHPTQPWLITCGADSTVRLYVP